MPPCSTEVVAIKPYISLSLLWNIKSIFSKHLGKYQVLHKNKNIENNYWMSV